MNTRLDRFIPLCTTTQGSGPKKVRIFHSNGAGSDEFAFEDIAGAWAFQRAVTGYQVVGDEAFVGWTGRPSLKETISRLARGPENRVQARGSGRVQVWFWNPWTGAHSNVPEEQLADSSSSTTPTGSSLRAGRSILSGATSILDSASVLTAERGSERASVQVVTRADGTTEAIALKSPSDPHCCASRSMKGRIACTISKVSLASNTRTKR
ncbi:hypothetical protein VUR80DRAFT_1684 [Thermomyces stellatus]